MQSEEQHPLVSSKERLLRAQLQEGQFHNVAARTVFSYQKPQVHGHPQSDADSLVPAWGAFSHFPTAAQLEAAWWLQVAQEQPPHPWVSPPWRCHLGAVLAAPTELLRLVPHLVPCKHTPNSQVISSQLTQAAPLNTEAGKA